MNELSAEQNQNNESKALPFEVGRGWTAMPNAAITVYSKHPSYNTTAIVLYNRLLNYYSTNYGYAYPTRARLAIDLGMSVESVKRAIKALKEMELIDVKRNYQFNNNNYYFLQPVETVEELKQKFPQHIAKIEKKEAEILAILQMEENDKQRFETFKKAN